MGVLGIQTTLIRLRFVGHHWTQQVKRAPARSRLFKLLRQLSVWSVQLTGHREGHLLCMHRRVPAVCYLFQARRGMPKIVSMAAWQ